MDLRFKCVICGADILHPMNGEFACRNDECTYRLHAYKRYERNKRRKSYKLKPIMKRHEK